jgi:heme/copper-type cytochrome/quinol oxidase subunit 3
MIQRIQSIFLFLATLTFGSLFAVPFALTDTAAAGFLSDGDYDINDHVALLILTILGCLVSVIAIFAFKNRKSQQKLVYGVIILGLLLPVAAFLLFTGDAPNMFSSGEVNDQAGLYMPFLAAVFGFLAKRYITKDEKLVKSMDRLR